MIKINELIKTVKTNDIDTLVGYIYTSERGYFVKFGDDDGNFIEQNMRIFPYDKFSVNDAVDYAKKLLNA